MKTTLQKGNASELELRRRRADDTLIRRGYSCYILGVFFGIVNNAFFMPFIREVDMPLATHNVIAYVDGFNLYFGLRSKNWRKYYWLDLVGLVRSLLKTDQNLVAVHYFTARIRSSGNNEADMQRQADYLDALGHFPDLIMHYGHYLNKLRKCRHCGAQWMDYEEKMTDVNIAVQLLEDAFDDRFATALLLSADSDLTTPVKNVRDRFPQKRVIVAQPPGRNSEKLRRVAFASFTIGEAKFRQNQLPPTITMPNGYQLQRPDYWK